MSYETVEDKTVKFIQVITTGDATDLEVRKTAWQTYLDADGFLESGLSAVDRDILKKVCVEGVSIPANRLLGNIIDTRVDLAAGRLLHRLDPKLLDNKPAQEFARMMFRDIQVR